MPTLDQLNALANDVPALTQKAAQQKQAQQALQMQQQIQGTNIAGSGVSATQAAQAAAPAATNATAQIEGQALQTQQKGLADVGQTALENVTEADKASQATQEQAAQTQLTTQQNQQKMQLVSADLAMRKRVTADEQASAKRLSNMGIEQDNTLQMLTVRQRQQLSRIGGDVKQKIVDDRLQFERDELGRKFSNERQLADYNLATAKTNQDFQLKLQQMSETADRKNQLLQVAYEQINYAMQNGFDSEQQELSNETKAKLIQMKTDADLALQKARAAAGARLATYQAVGAVAGAIIGGVISGGAGAAAGAAAGSAAGTAVAANT